ncbi:hypothetical protein [Phenylobacterium sp.]|jgi:hypothetical protein|uniref:hypothetical protein n=1 Tax=Phenylobacterium sp. TaxID=1871053 RepID=UPI002F3ED687
MRHLMILGAVAMLSGCANTAAMRTLASQTSAHLATEQSGMDGFITAQKQLNQNNATLLDTLATQTALEQAQTALLVNAWTLAGQKDVLATQATAAKVDAPTIVASLSVTHATADTLDDGGAGASLQKAAGAYTAMAKKPSFKAQAQEIFASGNAVYQAAEKLKQGATSPTPAVASPSAPPPAATPAAKS